MRIISAKGTVVDFLEDDSWPRYDRDAPPMCLRREPWTTNGKVAPMNLSGLFYFKVRLSGIELENWEIPIEKTAHVVVAFATDKQKYLNAVALAKEDANRYKIDVVASQYIRLFKNSCNEHRL